MNILEQFPELKELQQLALRRGRKVYLVGGFIRDALLGHPKADFDFAVDEGALELAEAFASLINGAYILLDEERSCARVAKKVAGKVHTYDFAGFRGPSLEEDLKHRDFTINTLCSDVTSLSPADDLDSAVMDLGKGRRDLEKKRIKMTSIHVFKDDPLRILRAYSLRAKLGFRVDLRTLNQIKRDKDLLRDVSPERIREELFKICDSPVTAEIFKAMDKAGILEKVLPQVRVMYDCKQGAYHHLDVWPHSLEVVSQLDRLLGDFKDHADIQNYIEEDLGGHSRRSVMKLAALLHDIGKPETRKKEGERLTFHAHEHVGQDIVRNIAKMLKFSTKERHALENMVLWHLRPGYLSNFKQPSERAVYRYFRDTKEEAVSVLLLSLADQRSTRGPLTSESDQKHHERVCLSLTERWFEKQKEEPFIRLINGDDLKQKLKLQPSPLFGKILTEVEENQVLGKIKTKKEALSLAKDIMRKEKVVK